MSRVYVIHPTNALFTSASRINPIMATLGTALGVPPSELTTKPFSSKVVTRGGMPSAYSYSVVDLLHKGNPVDVARFVIVIGYVPQEGFDSILREGVANAAQKTTSFFTKEYEGLRNALRCALSQALGNIPTPTIRRFSIAEEIEIFEMRDVNNTPLPLE